MGSRAMTVRRTGSRDRGRGCARGVLRPLSSGAIDRAAAPSYRKHRTETAGYAGFGAGGGGLGRSPLTPDNYCYQTSIRFFPCSAGDRGVAPCHARGILRSAATQFNPLLTGRFRPPARPAARPGPHPRPNAGTAPSPESAPDNPFGNSAPRRESLRSGEGRTPLCVLSIIAHRALKRDAESARAAPPRCAAP